MSSFRLYEGLAVAALLFMTAGHPQSAVAIPLAPVQASPIAASMIVQARKKSPIDKSCLMVCDRWKGDHCEKWVMRCKGDPGYPKVAR